MAKNCCLKDLFLDRKLFWVVLLFSYLLIDLKFAKADSEEKEEPVEADCGSNKNGNLTDPAKDCTHYIKCVDGTPTESVCEAGQYFDETEQECVPKIKNRCKLAKVDVAEQACSPEGDIKLSTKFCDKFFVCQKKKYSLLDCPPGTVFNLKAMECEEIPDSCQIQTVDGKEDEEESEEEKDENNSKKRTSPYVDVCQNQQSMSKIPDPLNCQTYIQCENEKSEMLLQILKCSQGQLFSEKSLTCKNPITVVCGKRFRNESISGIDAKSEDDSGSEKNNIPVEIHLDSSHSNSKIADLGFKIPNLPVKKAFRIYDFHNTVANGITINDDVVQVKQSDGRNIKTFMYSNIQNNTFVDTNSTFFSQRNQTNTKNTETLDLSGENQRNKMAGIKIRNPKKGKKGNGTSPDDSGEEISTMESNDVMTTPIASELSVTVRSIDSENPVSQSTTGAPMEPKKQGGRNIQIFIASNVQNATVVDTNSTFSLQSNKTKTTNTETLDLSGENQRNKMAGSKSRNRKKGKGDNETAESSGEEVSSTLETSTDVIPTSSEAPSVITEKSVIVKETTISAVQKDADTSMMSSESQTTLSPAPKPSSTVASPTTEEVVVAADSQTTPQESGTPKLDVSKETTAVTVMENAITTATSGNILDTAITQQEITATTEKSLGRNIIQLQTTKLDTPLTETVETTALPIETTVVPSEVLKTLESTTKKADIASVTMEEIAVAANAETTPGNTAEVTTKEAIVAKGFTETLSESNFQTTQSPNEASTLLPTTRSEAVETIKTDDKPKGRNMVELKTTDQAMTTPEVIETTKTEKTLNSVGITPENEITSRVGKIVEETTVKSEIVQSTLETSTPNTIIESIPTTEKTMIEKIVSKLLGIIPKASEQEAGSTTEEFAVTTQGETTPSGNIIETAITQQELTVTTEKPLGRNLIQLPTIMTQMPEKSNIASSQTTEKTANAETTAQEITAQKSEISITAEQESSTLKVDTPQETTAIPILESVKELAGGNISTENIATTVSSESTTPMGNQMISGRRIQPIVVSNIQNTTIVDTNNTFSLQRNQTNTTNTETLDLSGENERNKMGTSKIRNPKKGKVKGANDTTDNSTEETPTSETTELTSEIPSKIETTTMISNKEVGTTPEEGTAANVETTSGYKLETAITQQELTVTTEKSLGRNIIQLPTIVTQIPEKSNIVSSQTTETTANAETTAKEITAQKSEISLTTEQESSTRKVDTPQETTAIPILESVKELAGGNISTENIATTVSLESTTPMGNQMISGRRIQPIVVSNIQNTTIFDTNNTFSLQRNQTNTTNTETLNLSGDNERNKMGTSKIRNPKKGKVKGENDTTDNSTEETPTSETTELTSEIPSKIETTTMISNKEVGTTPEEGAAANVETTSGYKLETAITQQELTVTTEKSLGRNIIQLQTTKLDTPLTETVETTALPIETTVVPSEVLKTLESTTKKADIASVTMEEIAVAANAETTPGNTAEVTTKEAIVAKGFTETLSESNFQTTQSPNEASTLLPTTRSEAVETIKTDDKPKGRNMVELKTTDQAMTTPEVIETTKTEKTLNSVGITPENEITSRVGKIVEETTVKSEIVQSTLETSTPNTIIESIPTTEKTMIEKIVSKLLGIIPKASEQEAGSTTEEFAVTTQGETTPSGNIIETAITQQELTVTTEKPLGRNLIQVQTTRNEISTIETGKTTLLATEKAVMNSPEATSTKINVMGNVSGKTPGNLEIDIQATTLLPLNTVLMTSKETVYTTLEGLISKSSKVEATTVTPASLTPTENIVTTKKESMSGRRLEGIVISNIQNTTIVDTNTTFSLQKNQTNTTNTETLDLSGDNERNKMGASKNRNPKKGKVKEALTNDTTDNSTEETATSEKTKSTSEIPSKIETTAAETLSPINEFISTYTTRKVIVSELPETTPLALSKEAVGSTPEEFAVAANAETTTSGKIIETAVTQQELTVTTEKPLGRNLIQLITTKAETIPEVTTAEKIVIRANAETTPGNIEAETQLTTLLLATPAIESTKQREITPIKELITEISTAEITTSRTTVSETAQPVTEKVTAPERPQTSVSSEDKPKGRNLVELEKTTSKSVTEESLLLPESETTPSENEVEINTQKTTVEQNVDITSTSDRKMSSSAVTLGSSTMKTVLSTLKEVETAPPKSEVTAKSTVIPPIQKERQPEMNMNEMFSVQNEFKSEYSNETKTTVVSSSDTEIVEENGFSSDDANMSANAKQTTVESSNNNSSMTHEKNEGRNMEESSIVVYNSPNDSNNTVLVLQSMNSSKEAKQEASSSLIVIQNTTNTSEFDSDAERRPTTKLVNTISTETTPMALNKFGTTPEALAANDETTPSGNMKETSITQQELTATEKPLGRNLIQMITTEVEIPAVTVETTALPKETTILQLLETTSTQKTEIILSTVQKIITSDNSLITESVTTELKTTQPAVTIPIEKSEKTIPSESTTTMGSQSITGRRLEGIQTNVVSNIHNSTIVDANTTFSLQRNQTNTTNSETLDLSGENERNKMGKSKIRNPKKGKVKGENETADTTEEALLWETTELTPVITYKIETIVVSDKPTTSPSTSNLSSGKTLQETYATTIKSEATTTAVADRICENSAEGCSESNQKIKPAGRNLVVILTKENINTTPTLEQNLSEAPFVSTKEIPAVTTTTILTEKKYLQSTKVIKTAETSPKNEIKTQFFESTQAYKETGTTEEFAVAANAETTPGNVIETTTTQKPIGRNLIQVLTTKAESPTSESNLLIETTEISTKKLNSEIGTTENITPAKTITEETTLKERNEQTTVTEMPTKQEVTNESIETTTKCENSAEGCSQKNEKLKQGGRRLHEFTKEMTTKNEITTEITTRKEIPTEITAKNEITTEVTTRKEIPTEITTKTEITTEVTTRKQIPTEMTTKDEITNEVTTRKEILTEMTTKNEITTEITTGKEIGTQLLETTTLSSNKGVATTTEEFAVAANAETTPGNVIETTTTQKPIGRNLIQVLTTKAESPTSESNLLIETTEISTKKLNSEIGTTENITPAKTITEETTLKERNEQTTVTAMPTKKETTTESIETTTKCENSAEGCSQKNEKLKQGGRRLQEFTKEMTTKNEITTEITTRKEIPTEITAKNEITTEVTTRKEIPTEITAKNKITTEVTTRKEIPTEITTKNEITTEVTTRKEIPTEMTTKNEITKEFTTGKEIGTQLLETTTLSSNKGVATTTEEFAVAANAETTPGNVIETTTTQKPIGRNLIQVLTTKAESPTSESNLLIETTEISTKKLNSDFGTTENITPAKTITEETTLKERNEQTTVTAMPTKKETTTESIETTTKCENSAEGCSQKNEKLKQGGRRLHEFTKAMTTKNEITTEITTRKEIPTEITAKNEITTEVTTRKEIPTEITIKNEITTEVTTRKEIPTEMTTKNQITTEIGTQLLETTTLSSNKVVGTTTEELAVTANAETTPGIVIETTTTQKPIGRNLIQVLTTKAESPTSESNLLIETTEISTKKLNRGISTTENITPAKTITEETTLKERNEQTTVTAMHTKKETTTESIETTTKCENSAEGCSQKNEKLKQGGRRLHEFTKAMTTKNEITTEITTRKEIPTEITAKNEITTEVTTRKEIPTEITTKNEITTEVTTRKEIPTEMTTKNQITTEIGTQLLETTTLSSNKVVGTTTEELAVTANAETTPGIVIETTTTQKPIGRNLIQVLTTKAESPTSESNLLIETTEISTKKLNSEIGTTENITPAKTITEETTLKERNEQTTVTAMPTKKETTTESIETTTKCENSAEGCSQKNEKLKQGGRRLHEFTKEMTTKNEITTEVTTRKEIPTEITTKNEITTEVTTRKEIPTEMTTKNEITKEFTTGKEIGTQLLETTTLSSNKGVATTTEEFAVAANAETTPEKVIETTTTQKPIGRNLIPVLTTKPESPTSETNLLIETTEISTKKLNSEIGTTENITPAKTITEETTLKERNEQTTVTAMPTKKETTTESIETTTKCENSAEGCSQKNEKLKQGGRRLHEFTKEMTTKNEITTEITTRKEIPTEITAKNEITTEVTTRKEIPTEITAKNKITTEVTTRKEIPTEITTKNEITTEVTTRKEIPTEMTTKNEITKEFTTGKEIGTQLLETTTLSSNKGVATTTEEFAVAANAETTPGNVIETTTTQKPIGRNLIQVLTTKAESPTSESNLLIETTEISTKKLNSDFGTTENITPAKTITEETTLKERNEQTTVTAMPTKKETTTESIETTTKCENSAEGCSQKNEKLKQGGRRLHEFTKAMTTKNEITTEITTRKEIPTEITAKNEITTEVTTRKEIPTEITAKNKITTEVTTRKEIPTEITTKNEITTEVTTRKEIPTEMTTKNEITKEFTTGKEIGTQLLETTTLSSNKGVATTTEEFAVAANAETTPGNVIETTTTQKPIGRNLIQVLTTKAESPTSESNLLIETTEISTKKLNSDFGTTENITPAKTITEETTLKERNEQTTVTAMPTKKETTTESIETTTKCENSAEGCSQKNEKLKQGGRRLHEFTKAMTTKNEITTEITTRKEIPTEITAKNEITTEVTTRKEIPTEITIKNEITTEVTTRKEIPTEMTTKNQITTEIGTQLLETTNLSSNKVVGTTTEELAVTANAETTPGIVIETTTTQKPIGRNLIQVLTTKAESPTSESNLLIETTEISTKKLNRGISTTENITPAKTITEETTLKERNEQTTVTAMHTKKETTTESIETTTKCENSAEGCSQKNEKLKQGGRRLHEFTKEMTTKNEITTEVTTRKEIPTEITTKNEITTEVTTRKEIPTEMTTKNEITKEFTTGKEIGTQLLETTTLSSNKGVATTTEEFAVAANAETTPGNVIETTTTQKPIGRNLIQVLTTKAESPTSESNLLIETTEISTKKLNSDFGTTENITPAKTITEETTLKERNEQTTVTAMPTKKETTTESIETTTKCENSAEGCSQKNEKLKQGGRRLHEFTKAMTTKNEITTEITTRKEIPTEITAKNEITTEVTTRKEIPTEITIKNEITTEVTTRKEIPTEMTTKNQITTEIGTQLLETTTLSSNKVVGTTTEELAVTANAETTPGIVIETTTTQKPIGRNLIQVLTTKAESPTSESNLLIETTEISTKKLNRGISTTENITPAKTITEETTLKERNEQTTVTAMHTKKETTTESIETTTKCENSAEGCSQKNEKLKQGGRRLHEFTKEMTTKNEITTEVTTRKEIPTEITTKNEITTEVTTRKEIPTEMTTKNEITKEFTTGKEIGTQLLETTTLSSNKGVATTTEEFAVAANAETTPGNVIETTTTQKPIGRNLIPVLTTKAESPTWESNLLIKTTEISTKKLNSEIGTTENITPAKTITEETTLKERNEQTTVTAMPTKKETTTESIETTTKCENSAEGCSQKNEKLKQGGRRLQEFTKEMTTKNEITTEITTRKEIPTEITAKNEITTEVTTRKEIPTEMTTKNEITTEITTGKEIGTQLLETTTLSSNKGVATTTEEFAVAANAETTPGNVIETTTTQKSIGRNLIQKLTTKAESPTSESNLLIETTGWTSEVLKTPEISTRKLSSEIGTTENITPVKTITEETTLKERNEQTTVTEMPTKKETTTELIETTTTKCENSAEGCSQKNEKLKQAGRRLHEIIPSSTFPTVLTSKVEQSTILTSQVFSAETTKVEMTTEGTHEKIADVETTIEALTVPDAATTTLVTTKVLKNEEILTTEQLIVAANAETTPRATVVEATTPNNIQTTLQSTEKALTTQEEIMTTVEKKPEGRKLVELKTSTDIATQTPTVSEIKPSMVQEITSSLATREKAESTITEKYLTTTVPPTTTEEECDNSAEQATQAQKVLETKVSKGQEITSLPSTPEKSDSRITETVLTTTASPTTTEEEEECGNSTETVRVNTKEIGTTMESIPEGRKLIALQSTTKTPIVETTQITTSSIGEITTTVQSKILTEQASTKEEILTSPEMTTKKEFVSELIETTTIKCENGAEGCSGSGQKGRKMPELPKTELPKKIPEITTEKELVETTSVKCENSAEGCSASNQKVKKLPPSEATTVPPKRRKVNQTLSENVSTQSKRDKLITNNTYGWNMRKSLRNYTSNKNCTCESEEEVKSPCQIHSSESYEIIKKVHHGHHRRNKKQRKFRCMSSANTDSVSSNKAQRKGSWKHRRYYTRSSEEIVKNMKTSRQSSKPRFKEVEAGGAENAKVYEIIKETVKETTKNTSEGIVKETVREIVKSKVRNEKFRDSYSRESESGEEIAASKEKDCEDDVEDAKSESKERAHFTKKTVIRPKKFNSTSEMGSDFVVEVYYNDEQSSNHTQNSTETKSTQEETETVMQGEKIREDDTTL